MIYDGNKTDEGSESIMSEISVVLTTPCPADLQFADRYGFDDLNDPRGHLGKILMQRPETHDATLAEHYGTFLLGAVKMQAKMNRAANSRIRI